jgi:hypothetical protein
LDRYATEFELNVLRHELLEIFCKFGVALSVWWIDRNGKVFSHQYNGLGPGANVSVVARVWLNSTALEVELGGSSDWGWGKGWTSDRTSGWESFDEADGSFRVVSGWIRLGVSLGLGEALP